MDKARMSRTHYSIVPRSNNPLKSLKKLNSIGGSLPTQQKAPPFASIHDVAKLRYMIITKSPNYNIHSINIFNPSFTTTCSRNTVQIKRTPTISSNMSNHKLINLKYRDSNYSSSPYTHSKKKKKRKVKFEIKGEKLSSDLIPDCQINNFNKTSTSQFENVMDSKSKYDADNFTSPTTKKTRRFYNNKSFTSSCKRPITASINKLMAKHDYCMKNASSYPIYKGIVQLKLERRACMVNRPIVIFIFEGVIGDYFRESLFVQDSDVLIIRPRNTISRA